VLHLINGQHYAGAERVQDLLADRLPALGFEVGFACLKPDRFPALRHTRRALLHRVPMRTRFDLRAAWRVAAIVRCKQYRLIHAHTPRSALVGRLAASLARVPMVYHVHSPASRDTTRRLRNRINATIERWSLRGARRLIPVSSSLAGHLEALGVAHSRIRVVPNGVPSRQPAWRRPPPRGLWTLGTVALFRPRKGVEVLLDALAILNREQLPVRLRAVGSFETDGYAASIEDRVARLGLADLVHWTGFQSDIAGELAAMDLFVLPSLFGEGLPMVVLEAMAAGVPVVATSVEGVPEAVRDGRDGVLARPGDPEDLARAIARVVRGDLNWERLRDSALARQAADFSDTSMAAGVARVYREVLDENL
jgi:glycosyltransferase involved in cell wall biosynthesis